MSGSVTGSGRRMPSLSEARHPPRGLWGGGSLPGTHPAHRQGRGVLVHRSIDCWCLQCAGVHTGIWKPLVETPAPLMGVAEEAVIKPQS